jgi:hypothetical protein
MEQTDRASLLHDFRRQIYKVMSLTSVGSRCLDIVFVALVVNYDAPDHAADYVHRICRTGRAGHFGRSVTFVGPDEANKAAEIVAAMRQSRVEPPTRLLKMVEEGKGRQRWGYSGHGFRFDRAECEAVKTGRLKLDEGEDFVKESSKGWFICEFIINDFPEPTRAALTLKDNIDAVNYEMGTTIIQKCSFVPSGLQPKHGEKKLFLLIESSLHHFATHCRTENSIQKRIERKRLNTTQNMNVKISICLHFLELPNSTKWGILHPTWWHWLPSRQGMVLHELGWFWPQDYRPRRPDGLLVCTCLCRTGRFDRTPQPPCKHDSKLRTRNRCCRGLLPTHP